MAEENKWSSKAEFVLSLVGYAVGFGNIWRFPYLCHRNGGGAFLIPYLTFLLLIGMPLFVFEISASQFSGFGVTRVWNMCPLFKGVGYGMVIYSTIVVSFYSTILTWIIYYFINSCTKVLPWSTCGNDWNTASCWSHRFANSTTDYQPTLNANSSAIDGGKYDGDLSLNTSYSIDTVSTQNTSFNWQSPAGEFWHNEALQLSPGMDQLGGVRGDLVGYMALSYLAIFLFICKGTKSIGKVVYVTATMPYLLLAILLVRSLLLPGSYIGVKYYLIPDWKKLLQLRVWAEACLQILYSTGTSSGCLIVLASYNKFHNNSVRDAVVVPLIGCMTSFLAGFVSFSVLGFMAFRTGQTVDKVVESGPGLVFVAYPEAISNMPLSPLWAVLFFIMLFVVGVDSQMVLLETVVDGITGIYPKLFKGNVRIAFIGALCIIFFLIGILFCTRAGMYYLMLFDWYVVTISVTIISILEAVSVYWIYGHRRFYHDIKLMIGHEPCIWWKICWGFITPAILLAMTVYNLLALKAPYYGDYTFPVWSVAVGYVIALSSFIPIPLYMVICLLKEQGSLRERFKKSLRPSKSWVPADKEEENAYDYDAKNPGCTSRATWSCCNTYTLNNTTETVALNKV